MIKLKLLILLFGIFLSTISLAKVNDIYPFEQVEKRQEFNGLLKDLRCLVCQNQNLADSNAKLAIDMRSQVYALVKEGKTAAEVKNYLTSRYGDFILFKPPINPKTYFLWVGPFVILLLAIGSLLFIIKKRSTY